MKKIKVLSLALLLLVVPACATQEESTKENQALIVVNAEGSGQVAVAQADETFAFDDEHPIQSTGTYVDKGSEVTIGARPEEGFQFVKWTKDGEDFSTESQLTVVVDQDVEYRAVFMMGSGYEGETITSIDQAKTIGDVLGLPYFGNLVMEGKFALAFEFEGNAYNAIADITPETFKALMDLDFDDPDYQTKFNELVAPLEISQLVNITERIPAQEDLQKYIGKTGQELIDEGWSFSWYNDEDKEFGLIHEFFTYKVKFDGDVEFNDNFDGTEEIKDLKVTSIEYDSIGDPTYIPE